MTEHDPIIEARAADELDVAREMFHAADVANYFRTINGVAHRPHLINPDAPDEGVDWHAAGDLVTNTAPAGPAPDRAALVLPTLERIADTLNGERAAIYAAIDDAAAADASAADHEFPGALDALRYEAHRSLTALRDITRDLEAKLEEWFAARDVADAESAGR